MARAVYSPAQIVLLDDVLAALDIHTAKWIVDKCFRGSLIVGRTVLLVTHNVALVAPISNFVVELGLDGRVIHQGSLDYITYENPVLQQSGGRSLVTADNDNVISTTETSATGKLIAPEQIALGRIAWSAVELYTHSLGGSIFWSVLLTAMSFAYVLGVLELWFLGYWAAQYDGHDASSVPVIR